MTSRFGLSVLAGLAVANCGSAASKPEQSRGPLATELVTKQGDRDVFPSEFHGDWARDQNACRDEDGKGVLRITAGRITGYESDAILLKNALAFEQTPHGQTANTLRTLVAESGEGELGLRTFRISRTANLLYITREDTKSEQHWSYPLVRCLPA